MAKIDKIKEQIGYLKVVFSILIAILVLIVGWMTNHFDGINTLGIKTVLAVVLSFFVAIGIVYVNKKIIKYINELEDI